MSLALHCQRLGEGPPVLVLHGLFGSGTNWRSIARALADRHTIWLVDQRNHGRSPHGAGMDYATMAADLGRVLDDHGIERAALVGHSMGGKTAMRFALEHPRRVTRLVVVDIAPGPSAHGHRDVLDALLALDPARCADRAAVDRALAATVPDAGLRAFLLQNLVTTPGEPLRWRLGLPEIRAAIDDLVAFDAPPGARFEGPALFVHGSLSDYVRESDHAAIHALFPQARIETVEGAGHWVHAARPAEFLDVLGPFLDER